MEKPGPRTTARPLIIERPDLQSPPQRVLSAGLTALLWAVWAYLWLPVIALLGWLFGASRFYEEMVVASGDVALLELLGWYALVIGLLAGSLVCWASYNFIRFRGKERRSIRRATTIEEIAARAGFKPDVVRRWQQAQMLSVRHDASGAIESVEIVASTHARTATADGSAGILAGR
ncbi:MAG: poly-beta-1,6-N-acetyl-D-glucosamine biosynthesis protein PgaD [Burkholderiaceae bacterium]|nr:poly-beta-1,6-N-acetyl-D-glucosamine biosynthesis protein PgaD [Burkholderiaceae bacterium]